MNVPGFFGRVYDGEGDMGVVIINPSRQFSSIVVAAIPINIDGTFGARLINVNFFTPSITHREIHSLYKPCAMQPREYRVNVSTGSISKFIGCLPVAVGTEFFVAIISIGRKDVR